MKRRIKSQTLHIGCGQDKYPGSIGVDINPQTEADVIHDLNRYPYPFASNSFSKIIAYNIIEHIDDVIQTMEELYRIGKNGGKIIITTGHFSGVDSFTDPTHKHFFTSRTFDYFISGTDLFKYNYSKARFIKRVVWVGPKKTPNVLLYLLLHYINKHVVMYEKRFAFIFPVGTIYYELEINKKSRKT